MEQILSVFINNKKVTDPQKIADAVSTCFWKITENLDLCQQARGNAISCLKNAFPRMIPEIIPTTETEIKSIIQSLEAKYSTDYDGITSKILKACASLINHPLTHIGNHSRLMGTFPNHLKIPVVRPLHKKGDKTNMSNCRPISLLTFSKVIENAMHNRISHYLKSNNI
jgi:hypothetical protein